MNLQKFKEFVETVDYINRLNEDSAAPYFIVIRERQAKVYVGFRYIDFSNVIGIIAVGRKLWKNGPYTNTSGTLLAMADSQCNIVDRLKISDKWSIVDVDFVKYRGSYYDCFKPIVKLANNVTREELDIASTLEEGWAEVFPDIFDQLFKMLDANSI